jgi:hypothetical protein
MAWGATKSPSEQPTGVPVTVRSAEEHGESRLRRYLPGWAGLDNIEATRPRFHPLAPGELYLQKRVLLLVESCISLSLADALG